MLTEPTLEHSGFAVPYAHGPHVQMGLDCAVHTHSSWVPMCWHHIWPQGMGGPDTAANKLHLCYNAHYSIHEFIRQLIKYAGVVPWEIAQHFSTKERDYARIGWEKAGSPTSGTVGE